MLVLIGIKALPEGQPRLKASAYMTDIAELWRAKSKEDKIASTTDSLKLLEEHRENKTSARHNNFASEFRDAQSTLLSIKKEVVFPYDFFSDDLFNR